MTLLLQPVFVDLGLNNGTASGDHSDTESPFETNGTKPSEDGLHSMWKVATKVKSVMAGGIRFENLTWRAWYRKNQLEKFEKERRELNKTNNSAPSIPSSCSQATAIPNYPAHKAATYGNGYSSILAEIQQASMRKSTSQVQGASPIDFVSGSLPSKVISSSSGTHSESSTSTNSKTSVPETSTRNSRRRKKNVDKFIRKQQLERISEQTEESRTSGLPVPSLLPSQISKAERTHVVATHLENSSISTNDTISSGSIGEPSLRPKIDDYTLFRRTKYSAQKTSSPASDKPNVSLLTMLLNRGSESRRPESCPPPVLGMSPPTRPGAPHPPEVAEGFLAAAPNIATTCTSSESTTTKQVPELIPSPISSLPGSTTPQPSSNQRRRTVPNPSEFTTPLFIW